MDHIDRHLYELRLHPVNMEDAIEAVRLEERERHYQQREHLMGISFHDKWQEERQARKEQELLVWAFSMGRVVHHVSGAWELQVQPEKQGPAQWAYAGSGPQPVIVDEGTRKLLKAVREREMREDE